MMSVRQIFKQNKHFVFVDEVVTFSQNYITITLLQTRSKHNKGKTLCMQHKSSQVCRHNGIENKSYLTEEPIHQQQTGN